MSSMPDLFVGAVENPFGDPQSYRVKRLEKKARAGAEFIQTQCIYNMARFKEFMTQVRDRGLDKKLFILGGVTPLKSARMAEYMRNNVAGMDVPDEIISRMKAAPAKEQRAEGIKIAVETIEALREVPGVRGVHIMAIEWEEAVPELTEKAGLLPRPEGLRSSYAGQISHKSGGGPEPVRRSDPIGSHRLGRGVPAVRPLRKERLRLQSLRKEGPRRAPDGRFSRQRLQRLLPLRPELPEQTDPQGHQPAFSFLWEMNTGPPTSSPTCGPSRRRERYLSPVRATGVLFRDRASTACGRTCRKSSALRGTAFTVASTSAQPSIWAQGDGSSVRKRRAAIRSRRSSSCPCPSIFDLLPFSPPALLIREAILRAAKALNTVAIINASEWDRRYDPYLNHAMLYLDKESETITPLSAIRLVEIPDSPEVLTGRRN